MTFNPAIQNRASFVRGRGKTVLDSILMPIAEIVSRICPINEEKFVELFDFEISQLMPTVTDKTVSNWRTEISHQLFGLIIYGDGIVSISPRAERLLISQDQTAFFREIAFQFQFPFPGGTKATWELQQGMSLRPGIFIIQLLSRAEGLKIRITREEIFYYVLNSLEVQKGLVSVEEVLDCILMERRTARSQGFPVPTTRNSAFDRQHLTEFLGYLELSGLVVAGELTNGDGIFYLNTIEQASIDSFCNADPRKLDFVWSSSESHAEIRARWDIFWTKIETSVEASFAMSSPSSQINLQVPKVSVEPDLEIGRRGELYVLELERERIVKSHPNLITKLKDRANERNIGYDIQSVRASYADSDHELDEFIYIEVKSTKRATPVGEISETINMTRNEWIKAKDSRENFYLYRVYFTVGETKVFVIQDPFGQNGVGVNAVPTNYQVSLKSPLGEWIENVK